MMRRKGVMTIAADSTEEIEEKMKEEIDEELHGQRQREKRSEEEHDWSRNQYERTKDAIAASNNATKASVNNSRESTWSKLNSFADRMNSKASAVGSYASGLVNTESTVMSERLFLLIVFGLHLADLFIGFRRTGGLALTWLLIYALLALVVAPLLINGGRGWLDAYTSKKVIIFVGVSALAWVLPILISKLPDVIIGNVWFKFLVMISPPWVLFLFFANVHDELVIKFRNLWVIIWIILAIIIILSSITRWNIPVELQGQYSFNPLEVLKEIWFTVWNGIKDIIAKLVGIPTTLGVFVNRNINDSIGRNFMGQVDPYTEGDLGVRFTEIRTFSKVFFADQEITVWADIQGESFKEEIVLNLKCYALSGDGQQFNGTIKSQSTLKDGSIHIKMREKISASCTFTSLPKGMYRVWFVGAFPFETWGYIQYYFAPDELVKNMWSQNLDPASEAGIAKRPVGIFTNGPVQLGLASEYDQPIPVNHLSNPETGDSPDRTLPPFGASLTNLWVDGHIQSVRHITLMVPEPFILKNCDRMPATGGTKDAPGFVTRVEMLGYREYTFGNIDGTGTNLGSESVVCFLGFYDPANAAVLMSSYDLVVKTFAAKTNYMYIIEKYTQVKVQ
jgi:hypothetical protein